MADKGTCIVTGACLGIGRATAEEMARRGFHVWLASPSEERLRVVADGIKSAGGEADIVKLDLADFDSVRSAAKTILARGEPIQVLVNNAGLGGISGFTPSGFEPAFGINYVGHYLLTRLLLDNMRALGGKARVVVVASDEHRMAKGIEWDVVRKPKNDLKWYEIMGTGSMDYGRSKLACVLFAKELGRRVPEVHTYSLHPGIVATSALDRMPWGLRHIMKRFMLTPEQGCQTSVYCATSDAVKDASGLYYEASAVKEPSKISEDAALARELWEKTAAWCDLPA